VRHRNRGCDAYSKAVGRDPWRLDSPTRISGTTGIFAVVSLDVGMPGMNGLEVARRIRSRSELVNVLIVAVTG
jgi:CheY-like chemotaxis protein